MSANATETIVLNKNFSFGENRAAGVNVSIEPDQSMNLLVRVFDPSLVEANRAELTDAINAYIDKAVSIARVNNIPV